MELLSLGNTKEKARADMNWRALIARILIRLGYIVNMFHSFLKPKLKGCVQFGTGRLSFRPIMAHCNETVQKK